jgi:hypothetical protein
MIGFGLSQNATMVEAIKLFGDDAQLNMVVEELAELILAVQKLRRYGNDKEVECVIDEMADVHVMLRQLEIILEQARHVEVEKLIQNRVDFKLEKTVRKIKETKDAVKK